MRDNSSILFLLNELLKHQSCYNDVAFFYLSYEVFKALCREAWKAKHNYPAIDSLDDGED